MFNGIIKYTGLIKNISRKNNNCIIEIFSKIKLSKDDIGSSISCSGACLTVENYNKNLIKFYLSKETLKRTLFKNSKKGDLINLEKPIKYGERISGHFVQGHVDTTSRVNKIVHLGKSWLVTFHLDSRFKKHLIEKASITINGVSLTVSKLLKREFQVSIIPKTLKLTNLTLLKEKDLVNVEFDILGKYIKNFIKWKK
tara:strand:- start:1399 stop:1992 length:594 start_codon:yes stop_codon:yes gene_type:complete